MKGNIIKELRNVVNMLYREGHEEVMGISVIKNGKSVDIQVVDFYFDTVVLDEKVYPKTYVQANRAFILASERCKGITAISALICSEIPETMYIDEKVLRVFNLNSDYIPKTDVRGDSLNVRESVVG